MGSIYITNLIFGKTLEDARTFLENIVEKLNYDDILEMKITKDNYQVTLKDGTLYKAVPATESARGLKCQKVYIQRGIDEEIINCVILPKVIPNLINENVEYF